MAVATKLFPPTFFSSPPLISPNNKKKKQHHYNPTRCQQEEQWKLSDGMNGRNNDKSNPTLWKNRNRIRENVRKRMPSKFAGFLQDNRRYQMKKEKQKKVMMEAVRTVRQLASKPAGSYNVRHVLSPFIGRLSFRDMCVILKELQGWRQAAEFFEWMKLQAKLDEGKLDDAMNLYTDMQAAGLVPSLHTYTTMISVFGKAGELDNAVQMFNSLQKSGISLDEKAYKHMINCYVEAGCLQEASKLFRTMQQEGKA